MDRIGVGFWGGMAVNELIDCISLADQKGYESAYLIESFADAFGVYGSAEQCSQKIARYREAGVTLPIVYPIHPTFTNYLPDAAARDGIRYIIEALAPG